MPPQTKPWNTSLESMDPDEQLYTDYKEEQRTVVNNFKFKATLPRCRLWIEVHRNHPDFQSVKWEVRSADVITLRTGSHNLSFGSVVVKFHLNTGVITIQGTAREKWKNLYMDLKKTVDNLSHLEPPSDLDVFISDLCSNAIDNRQRSASLATLDGRSASELGLSHNNSVELTDGSDIESDGELEVFSKSKSKSLPNFITQNDTTTVDLLQERYIRIIDGNNRAVENMAEKFELMKKHFSRSLSELKSQLTIWKTSTQESINTVATSLDSYHYDNNMYSERLKESHEELMVLKEAVTRYKDESFRLKKLNAELVTEISDLKSKLNSRRVTQHKINTERSSAFPAPIFRSATPNVTASPSRRKMDMSSSFVHNDTLSDEAIAKTLQLEYVQENRDSERQNRDLDSADSTSGPTPPTPVNPYEQPHVDKTDLSPEPSPGKTVVNAETYQKPVEVPPSGDKTDLSSEQSPGKTTDKDVTSQSPSGEVKVVNGGAVYNSGTSSSLLDNTDNGVNVNERDDAFSEQSAPRSQKMNLLMKADTIFLHDSTPKHVQQRRFMGAHLQSFSQRASTTGKALEYIKSWPMNSKVKYAFVHEGVNDITDNLSPDLIVRNLKSILLEMRKKYPNAMVCYSDILFIGRGDRQSSENRAVDYVNSEMGTFCTDEGFTRIPHNSLQSTQCRLFTDEKHIDGNGGTAVFVSDIYYATGFRKKGENSATTFYNSSRGRATPKYDSVKTSYVTGKVNQDVSDGNSNMKELLQMMCLSQQALVKFLSKT